MVSNIHDMCFEFQVYLKQEVGRTWKIICAKQVMSALPMSSKMGLESVNTYGMKTWNTACIHRLQNHLWRHRQNRHHLLCAYDLSSPANFLFEVNLKFKTHIINKKMYLFYQQKFIVWFNISKISVFIKFEKKNPFFPFFAINNVR